MSSVTSSLNTLTARIQDSTRKLASGTDGSSITNRVTTANLTPSSDTSDLTGIVNPDPNAANFGTTPNVSYNVARNTVSTIESDNNVDVAAETTRLSASTTQLSFATNAAQQQNSEKKRLLDILA